MTSDTEKNRDHLLDLQEARARIGELEKERERLSNEYDGYRATHANLLIGYREENLRLKARIQELEKPVEDGDCEAVRQRLLGLAELVDADKPFRYVKDIFAEAAQAIGFLSLQVKEGRAKALEEAAHEFELHAEGGAPTTVAKCKWAAEMVRALLPKG